jgi:hypothetical protein
MEALMFAYGIACGLWTVFASSVLALQVGPMASTYQSTAVVGSSRQGWPRQVQRHLNEALDFRRWVRHDGTRPV